MWPYLRKAGIHTLNSKTHISPLNNSCTRWLTIQAGIDAESCPGCVSCGLFLRLFRCVHECLGYLQMAAYPTDKHTAGCNSHDWLMSLAMDLVTLCDMWRLKWYQRMPFDCFSEDIALACHFVATCPCSTLLPCSSASGIGYACK